MLVAHAHAPSWDDPRAGGDDERPTLRHQALTGRSPRWRGRRVTDVRPGASVRTIPALAGTTAARSPSTPGLADDPRAGGDDTMTHRSRHDRRGRSPRWRGRLTPRASGCLKLRTIPALAGTTSRASATAWTTWDDPRAGGDDLREREGARWQCGRSPRWRGRQPRISRVPGRQRTIPALAGTTSCTAQLVGRGGDDPRAGGDDVPRAALPELSRGRSPRWRGRLPFRRLRR